MNRVEITEVCEKLLYTFYNVKFSGKPVVVTRGGKAVAAIISLDDLDQLVDLQKLTGYENTLNRPIPR